MILMKKGKLIVISGPSGVGKSTIREKIINTYDNYWYSISMTTRLPRDGEIDGIDYYFVSKDEFLNNIKNNNFVEYAEVYEDVFYGTPKNVIDEKLSNGFNVILEIDVFGALNIKKLYPDAKIAMHPELPDEVLKYADYIGATSGIIKFAESCDDDVIVGTEKSISDYLSIRYPDRAFPVMSKKLICPDMRITNLGDVLRTLKGNGFEVDVLEDVRVNAKKAIDKMIELG